MSLQSIIRKAGTKCDIKYESTSVGDGGKLIKTWVTRYEQVPMRIERVILRTAEEMLLYDREKVSPKFIMRMEYKSGITTRDRIYYGTREFEIKEVHNWDEQNLWLRIVAEEITTD